MTALIGQIARKVFAEQGTGVRYKVSALIELPRAALCAGDIAQHVDFSSIGTNDLTQMTFGFSCKDAQQSMGAYLAREYLSRTHL